MRTVGAREANQQFSSLLSEVEKGGTVVITRHGRPVARLVPEPAERGEASKGVEELIRRFARPMGGRPLVRDELHGRGSE